MSCHVPGGALLWAWDQAFLQGWALHAELALRALWLLRRDVRTLERQRGARACAVAVGQERGAPAATVAARRGAAAAVATAGVEPQSAVHQRTDEPLEQPQSPPQS